jgi:DedD protein
MDTSSYTRNGKARSMRSNERGGIISKLIIIPAGITLMIGFFFLGYYVGKYQGKPGTAGEKIPPLPELVVKSLPKPEEYTFFKTLTEKDGKNISIELKPKGPGAESKAEKKQAAEQHAENGQAPAKVKDTEKKKEEKKAVPAEVKPAAPAASPPTQKAAAPKPEATPKLRYTVQIASYQDKQSATEDVKKMKQNGYAAFVLASDVPGKGTWYRVRIGSFTKKESAEKLSQDIHAKAGVTSLVVLE